MCIEFSLLPESQGFNFDLDKLLDKSNYLLKPKHGNNPVVVSQHREVKDFIGDEDPESNGSMFKGLSSSLTRAVICPGSMLPRWPG